MRPVRGVLRRGRAARDILVDHLLGPPFARDSWTDVHGELLACRYTLERVLTENIVPFWTTRVVDDVDGGYRLHHDTRGTWLGPAPKHSIAQARVVWFFARLARTPFGDRTHLAIAGHGFDFYRRYFWDQRHGGAFWAVSSAGAPTQMHKHIRAQSFWLFALAAYAAASGLEEARRSADQMFELIEERGYDEQHGGYLQAFGGDWAPLAADSQVAEKELPAIKRTNTQLHVLESYIEYYRLTGSALARKRLTELMGLLARTLVDPRSGSGFEFCHRDWQPDQTGSHDRVTYGHDIERVWLVIDAARALGVPLSGYLAHLQRMFDAALRFGYDRYRDGFYERGPRARPPSQRRKTWWVQAEALVTALRLYEITGDARYGRCFLGTLRWVERHQVDWHNGDWHAYLLSRDRIEGLKASNIKTPYHNGRAMLMCLDMLDGLVPATA